MSKRLVYLTILVLVAALVGNASADLVGWWKLDEGEGDIAYDSAGENDGTVYGTQWTTGKVGGALSFDGIDDYVNCGNDPSLNITGAVTVSAWIKLSARGIDQKVAGNQDGSAGGYKMTVFSNNKVEFEIQTSTNQAVLNRNELGGTVLTSGVWYHVAGVYSQQGNYIRTYVDGNLDRELVTTKVLAPTSGTLKLGREPFSNSYFWNGLLDDVRIYDSALSAEEIMQLYGEGLGGRAFNPEPCDGAMSVATDVVLSWSPGTYAASHDVYFGKSTPLPFKGNQTAAVYEPGTLPENTTYWWRIDEVGPGGTIPGELRIIAWNIEFLGERSPRRTPEQLDAIAERILGFDAVVLALQERADVSTSEYIRSRLGPSWKIYPYSDNWNALLYDEDKVEMLSVELLYTLDNAPYSPYPGYNIPVTGVFRPARMPGAEPFRVIGVHCAPGGGIRDEG